MGRDSGDSARLLARLTTGPTATTSGWSDGDGARRRATVDASPQEQDPFPAGTGKVRGWDDEGQRAAGEARRGRHVDGGPARRGPGWRVTGVPPGLAVLLLVAAVVGVLLLGRGGGAEEVLVGPAGSSPTDRAVVAEGVVGDVVEDETGGTEGPVGTESVDPEVGPGSGSAVVAAGPLLVHVDGAVERPGVVELPPGSRVADAVRAAGGATDEADTTLVNLARPLTDGELVVVPRPGEQVAAPGPGGGAGSGPAGGPGAGPGAGDAAAGGLVDLNAADATVLDELPGIGPVLADRIVTWREESGPFTAVDDLTEVSGIGPAVLSDIRDLVTV